MAQPDHETEVRCQHEHEADSPSEYHTWEDFFAIRDAVAEILTNVSHEVRCPDSEIWATQYLCGDTNDGAFCGVVATRLAVEVGLTVQRRLERRGFSNVYVRFVAAEDKDEDEEEMKDIMVLLGGWSGRDVAEREGNEK